MAHKRETQMVCNLHFTTYFRLFWIWNRRAFQERKPYKFPGWMQNSPYYYPGRGANPRPPAHPDFITSKESHALLVRPYGGVYLHNVPSLCTMPGWIINRQRPHYNFHGLRYSCGEGILQWTRVLFIPMLYCKKVQVVRSNGVLAKYIINKYL